MSFIFNLFSDNSTPEQRENAAILKNMVEERKAALRAECKAHETAYNERVEAAKAEYKQKQQEAKDQLHRETFSAVNREMDAIVASEAFAGSDERTKSKIESVRSWLTSAAQRGCYGCGGGGYRDTEKNGQREELFMDEKNKDTDTEGQLPLYSPSVEANVADTKQA
ncbi:hypothetical protein BG004_002083 [Podila humilis]|nr:hypothetical protein BG004_002083 [Podila humilis]